MRKLATADREPCRDKSTTWTAVAPDLVFTVLTYGPSPLYGPPLQRLKGQGLWGLGVEGESGLAEESGDEAGLPLDAVQLVPHRGGELVCGAGGKVTQAVLHH